MYNNVLTLLIVPIIFLVPIGIGFMMTWLLQRLFIWMEEITNIYLHWFCNIFILFVVVVIFNNLDFESFIFYFG